MKPRPLTIAVLGDQASVHVRARAQALATRGHRVVWLASVAAAVEGVEVVVLADEPRPGSWRESTSRALSRRTGVSLLAVHRLWGLRRALKELEPDVLHVHYAYGRYAWAAAALDWHPLAVTVMGGDVLFDEQGKPSALGKWLTLQLLRQADLITAKSDHLVATLNQMGPFGERVLKVVWGVNLENFRRVDSKNLRARLQLSDNERVLLSPRALRPFYNIHVIVDAFAILVRRFPDLRLVLAEYSFDDTYKQQLLAQITSLGLSGSVIFPGPIAHHEMPEYYSLADVCIAIPPSDGMPQALLEAMACGTPNVISRLDRYREMVTDEQSCVFVNIDAASVADGVSRLLTDPALADRLRRTGRPIVEERANLLRETERFEAAVYALLESPLHRSLSKMRRALMLASLALAR